MNPAGGRGSPFLEDAGGGAPVDRDALPPERPVGDERAARARGYLLDLCVRHEDALVEDWLQGIVALPLGRTRFAARPLDEVRANVRACVGAFRAILEHGSGESLDLFAAHLAGQRLATGFSISAPLLATAEFRAVVSRTMRRAAAAQAFASEPDVGAFELEILLAADDLILRFEQGFTEAFVRCSLAATEERYRERIRLAEKLLSVGQVAASVAHELNNPLAWVMTNVEHLRASVEHLGGARLPSQDEIESLRRSASEALAGLERMRDIVTDLNVYSRSADRTVEEVSLPDILDLALRMTEPQLGLVARVERDYGALPPIFGYPGKLSQVFVNLFVNAAQAMNEADRRTNVVRVVAREEDGEIIVRVTDNGAGMAPEVAARVFEPFFTTKDESLRSGLGLWVSRSIVEEHGGAMTVASAPGVGTTFTIRMRGLEAPELPRMSVSPSTRPRARGTLLFVDDEPMLLNAFVRALGDEHEVLVAESAAAALEVLKSRGGRVDVIVCDLLMPGVSGMDLYEDIQRMFPALARRVVFMTGGAFTARLQQLLDAVPNPKLAKPVTLDALERVVLEVIAAEGPAA